MAFELGLNELLQRVREALNYSISSAPLGATANRFILLLGIVMIPVIIAMLKKGTEERKGLAGPIAIAIACFTVALGVNLLLVAWVILFFLSLVMVIKIKNGEWKGVTFIAIPMFILSLIVSVNEYLFIGAITLILGATWVAKHSNFARTYGTSAAAKIMKEQGYPVKKERKIIRGLARIARKGYGWSKDKLLRMQGKLKQRFAEREARNIEEQEHEAEIAAAGKKLAETIRALEEQQISLEERDLNLVAEILKYCQNLRRYLEGLKPEAVDSQKTKEIMAVSKQVLQLSNTLVKNKLDEESIMEKANKVLTTCMDVIHHSSNEAKQLKESRAEFREMKKAADASIARRRKEIGENLHGLERAKKRAEHSQSPKAHEEANLLGQRQSALSDVNKRLGTINGYVDAVLKRLAKINLAEDKRIQAVDAMNDKAERHKEKVEHFQKLFLHNAKELKKEHKKFGHLFKEGAGEIPDEQLLTITDSTVLMFQRLETLAEIAHEYNAKELKPLIAEMAEVLKNLKFLSEVSEYLTKMYYKMSKGMEELTKMAAIVDPNPESKKKL
ncbi:hypothetical protein KY359_02170, partial [Candidatus Woesearchaeota archaeon]|nr:hypothetical protein [Candidatus Woesearchaeota archaeon]